MSRMPKAPVALVAVILVAILYGRALWFGFDYGDYHFVHHYGWAEIGRAWIGTWDQTGIEPAFYRPLTVAFFAARVAVLGLDAFRMHLLGLVMFAGAAVLFALWLLDLGLSFSAALAGLLVFIAHPVMPLSAVVWITNQPHLLQLLLVLTALRVATRRPDLWGWLIVLQVAALLVKEDSLMLAPAIGVLWWFRSVRWPKPWIEWTLFTCVAFILVRTLALSGLGGYEAVNYAKNAVFGPLGVFLLVGDTSDHLTAALFIALAACALVFGHGSRRSVWLFAALLLTFNTILVFASWPNRWHLLVMAVSGLSAALFDRVPVRWAWPSAAVLVALMAHAGWPITDMSQPCSRFTLMHDARVRQWPVGAVTDDLRNALRDKSCGQ